MAGDRVMH